MLTEDKIQRGVRVRVLADLQHAQVKAGTVGEITEVRRNSRSGYWGFFIAWWVSPSRMKTSLRLTREDLPFLEPAGEEEPHPPDQTHEEWMRFFD